MVILIQTTCCQSELKAEKNEDLGDVFRNTGLNTLQDHSNPDKTKLRKPVTSVDDGIVSLCASVIWLIKIYVDQIRFMNSISQ
jgi:hypothetical protein